MENQAGAVPSLRLIAWNCHHGSLSARLAELAEHAPDVVFIQEYAPTDAIEAGQIVTRRVSPRKAIALASRGDRFRLEKLRPRPRSGRATLAAAVTGPVSFTALGIWSRGPNYADDVMRTLDAYTNVLRSGPAVVMGDLNSGADLNLKPSPSKGHARILGALADLGLVSAYHAFHEVTHGHESHATYRHLFKASRPWHIDFCFVPRSWLEHLARVDVIDGEDWAVRSDHLPLMVELQFRQCPSRSSRPLCVSA